MGKSAERKRNEKEIRTSTQSFDKTRGKLEGYKFTDQYAGLEAAQAQAGTLGGPSTYDAAQAQAGQIGQAQGYTAQGYDAAQATAAQAAKTNLGEGTGRTNQFANLQVSTAATDRKAAETDQALAAQQQSGLVTGGGGATALASAAAGSKADIAADLQGQEARNEQLRAQGATSVQQEDLQQRNLSRQANIQQDQYNTGLQQQTSLANQQATNQASQFTAGAQNQAAQFGAAAQNDFTSQQFGAENQFALANQQAQNQSYQFGASAQNQFAQAQFGADNQFAAQNAQSQNQFSLARAQGASQQQENQYNQLANLYSQDAAQKNAAFQVESSRKQRKSSFWGGIAGSAIGAAGAIASGGASGSDPRLKENIERIGVSESGIPIYEWDYKDGSGRYQGTMSTDVPKEALAEGLFGGYDGVYYDKIDVEFKRVG